MLRPWKARAKGNDAAERLVYETRDLDGVFHRLGACGKEGRLFGVVAVNRARCR
jgi:hypothetical protein